ncbi:hypothetical protein ABZP36_025741 [Zizania latifolia]
MPSQKDLFEVSGPTYLTRVDWNRPDHRRSVMASLVQGVYVLERDRQRNRQGDESRAPLWWRFFRFEMQQVLVDDADNSIFGAVYKFLDATNAASAPHYVVAFRGTIMKKASAPRDVTLNLHLVRNVLDGTSRFRAAMKTVYDVLESAAAARQHDRVWLAGHSLGSAISTLVAKNKAREGVVLTTFLFNAPFPEAQAIWDVQWLNRGIRVANSFVTAGVATVLRAGGDGGYDPFAMLARWVPNVFVHPEDLISSGYVGYFDHRKEMENIGLGAVGRLATRYSVKDLLLGIGRAGGCESLHLFPSAVLTVNRGPSRDFRMAHGIQQWWKPDLVLECNAYYY